MQKTEQEKLERRRKRGEKNEEVQKEIEERKDVDHANSQIAKILAYGESKSAPLTEPRFNKFVKCPMPPVDQDDEQQLFLYRHSLQYLLVGVTVG